ncbi:cytochrome P460 family protein [Aurantivibrio plasticivorans]
MATSMLSSLLRGLAIVAILLAVHTAEAQSLASTFESLIDHKGGLRLPRQYRQQWSHLGSWVIAEPMAPGAGLHDVYTQPEALESYRHKGDFPDGTVIVKDVSHIESGTLTTGHAQWAGATKIWFVMVRDTADRFPGNKHWQEGWGWALFDAQNPAKNISEGFEVSCKGCHLPAAGTHWVFTHGYPSLKGDD